MTECSAGGSSASCIRATCAPRATACLARAPSYADVLRAATPARQPSGPLQQPAAAAPTQQQPAAPQRGPSGEILDEQVVGRPRVTMPFSQLSLGKTTPPWLASSWRVGACRVAGNVLRVDYPRGSSNFDSGGPEGGCHFRARPACLPATDVTLSYRVRFPGSFEWSKGGKLPGLFVGFGDASGGDRSSTAASCRLMWQREGGAIAYLYPPSGVKQSAEYWQAAKRAGRYGDVMFGGAGLQFRRGDDTWNDVVLRVKLNGFDSDGEPVPDGVVTLAVNQQAATFADVIWRRRRDVRISHIAFTTFYGGKWRCPRDTYAEFKDVSCVA